MIEYEQEIARRINTALVKASQSGKAAWFLRRDTDGWEYYAVASESQSGVGHIQVARPNGKHGGYWYGDPQDDLSPAYDRFIDCSCPAFAEWGMPCYHAALVQLALEGQYREEQAAVLQTRYLLDEMDEEVEAAVAVEEAIPA